MIVSGGGAVAAGAQAAKSTARTIRLLKKVSIFLLFMENSSVEKNVSKWVFTLRYSVTDIRLFR
jgi:hypothetical protein